MSRTSKISVTNFKAVSSLEINFNGCSAIITAGNNKGKSSFLRGLMDRIRGEKPELIVKQGQDEGFYELELTTGEKFLWEFTKESEKLTFITKEGYKTKVTKEIKERFFPPSFDIDKFLNSPPKEQTKQLQKIVGLDFTEIDNRYRLAYDDRTEKNRSAEHYHVKLTKMLEVPFCPSIDITDLIKKKEEIRNSLNKQYFENKSHNDTLRKIWQDKKEQIDNSVRKSISSASEREILRDELIKSVNILEKNLYPDPLLSDLKKWIDITYPVISPIIAQYPEEPKYIDELPDNSELNKIDEQLLSASENNAKAKEYNEYISYKKTVEDARFEADQADDVVKGIELERKKMIESVKMPEGISFSEDGSILVDGYHLDKNQISTSKLYCAALRIAAMNIGEVHTLHFDASTLDKNTLSEIQAWAEKEDLQLLIERADYDAGEIHYELIERN
jgi:hypothetical protein